jgi:hypothetical protein
MATITLQLHRVDDGDLPDADLDVLLWDGQEPEAQLGAYVGDGWVNTHGEAVEGVHTWAHMPCLPVRVPVPDEVRELGTVPVLQQPWRLPA